MALVSFSGLASGIDSKSLIEALLQRERVARVNPLQDKVSTLQDTNSAFGELKGLLEKLKTAAQSFRELNGGVLSKEARSSDETILLGSTSNAATNGTYSVSVSQLAKSATYSFKSSATTYASGGTAINSSINNGASSSNRTVSVVTGTGSNQESVSVVLDNTTTLEQFVTSYNEQATKSIASVANIGTNSSPDYRVILTTNNPGLEKGQVSVTVGSEITSAGSGAFDSNTQQQATNATFTMSGVSGTITRSTNSVSDLIPGLTLDLQAIGTASLSVGDNKEATTATVQKFVDAYNEVINYISENDLVSSEQDGDTQKNIFGSLSGSSLDESILSTLRQSLVSAGTSGRTVNILADLGITTERDGTLKFDTTVFKDALSNDSEGVRTITQTLGEDLGAVSGKIAQFTQFNGLLDLSINSNNSEISNSDARIARIEKTLSTEEQSLTSRFARLESMIAQLTSQQTKLSALLPR